uniref:Beta-like casein 2 variant 3 n=1 Tax=Tachyglossus aculeatus TaxID=9261 RepID=D0QJA6_TACAU|nr:beta-like casein 2 variant 3 [Tachyglossus aculeatus]
MKVFIFACLVAVAMAVPKQQSSSSSSEETDKQLVMENLLKHRALVKDIPTTFSSEENINYEKQWEQLLRQPMVYEPFEIYQQGLRPFKPTHLRRPLKYIFFSEEPPKVYQPIQNEDSSSSSEEPVEVPAEQNHVLRLKKLQVLQNLQPLRRLPNYQVPLQRHPLPFVRLPNVFQAPHPVELPFPLPQVV